MKNRLLPWLALLLLAPAAWLRPPNRQQELRVLISARNMVETRDPFRPQFQNRPRYRKPPLPYWLAAAPMAASGVTDQAWLGRVPFVLATVGILFALARLAGNGAGANTVMIYLLSHGFWRFGMLAETDTLNLLGLVLAFLGWKSRSGPLAALGMCAGVLSKGPAALAIPVLSFVLLQRKDPRSLRFYLLAFLPPLICGAGWTLFLVSDPIAREALAAELTDTFVDSPHQKAPWYYLYTAPKILLPGLLAALWLLRPVASDARRTPRAPLVWFSVTFVLLTLTPSKQNHYALMLLPPAAWALGDALSRRALTPRPAWLAAGLLLVATAEVPRFFYERHSLNARFLREVRPLTKTAPTLHVVGINSAQFDFHLGRHVDNTDSAREALRRARPGDAVVVVQKREVFDAEAWPSLPLAESDGPRYIRRVYRD